MNNEFKKKDDEKQDGRSLEMLTMRALYVGNNSYSFITELRGVRVRVYRCVLTYKHLTETRSIHDDPAKSDWPLHTEFHSDVSVRNSNDGSSEGSHDPMEFGRVHNKGDIICCANANFANHTAEKCERMTRDNDSSFIAVKGKCSQFAVFLLFN